jgi:hypothetical protein
MIHAANSFYGEAQTRTLIDEEKAMEKDNKPVYEKRLGHIRVENVTEGKRWHNVAITRRYRQEDDWKEATTFNGLADLALVGECIARAKDWIARREEEA